MKLHSIILSALLTSTLFANDGQLALNTIDDYKIYTLEELMNITIISSTGIETKLSQAPSIATVITAEQIERSSARTLSEVLQMVPGINLYMPSANAMSNSYDIRGIKTGFNSQVLFLMNGTAMNNLFSSSPLINFKYPASAIKRIEVIRGPGSAVYGSDAFAGTINIVTKDSDYLINNSEIGVRYGSFDSTEVYANYGKKFENEVKLGLNLSYMTTNGDNSRKIDSDLQTVFDAIFGTSASNAPGSINSNYDVLNLNLNLKYEKFEMNIWGQISEKGTNAGIANTLDPDGKIEQEAIMSNFIYRENFASDIMWENKLNLTYLNNDMNYGTIFPSGTTLPIGDDGNLFTPGGGLVEFSDGVIGRPSVKEYWASIESTLYISKFNNHNIRASIGYSYKKLTASEKKNFGPGVIDGTISPIDGILTDVTNTPFIYSPDVDRKIFFISFQDEYTFKKDWKLTAGVRYDNYSDFGDTINPRIGLVWNTSEELTTKLLYGRAFRAPSSGELFWVNNPAILGNPNLDPETIDTVELGFHYRLKNIQNFINFYWYEANDLLSIVLTNIGQQYDNVGKQTGAGVEFETSYQATDKLLLSADYAYRWTQNDATKESVAEVPIHLVHAMFDYSFTKKLYLNSEVFYTADTPREVGDTRAKIDNYAVVNLSTGYRVTNGLEVLVAVRNLFDEEYVNPSNANPVNDYPMPGFNIYGELKYRF